MAKMAKRQLASLKLNDSARAPAENADTLLFSAIADHTARFLISGKIKKTLLHLTTSGSRFLGFRALGF